MDDSVRVLHGNLDKESLKDNKFTTNPQALFYEQVVLLDELPFLPLGPLATTDELHNVMRNRFRLPPLNESHVYLFPGSVRYLHPEFDRALEILLNTDSLAYVIVTLPRMVLNC